MGTLLQFRLELEAVPQPITGHDQFMEVARREGLEVSTIKLPGDIGDKVDVERLYEQIERAQGFWIRQPQLLDDARAREILESRLQAGAVAFVELGWQSQKGGSYVQSLGLEATSIRAVRKESNAADANLPAMLMTLSREDHPSAFRDAALFRGVDNLLLQQANGIGCLGSNTQPVIAVPSSAIRVLDMRTDYFVQNFPRPELPIFASAGKTNWRGQILASNVGLFADPYKGILGDYFPAIDGADNRIFARNLLRLIANGVAPPAYDWEQVFALISRIETSLARVTDIALRKKAGGKWFRITVPQELQIKCAGRAAGENSNFPVEAYLDLIDFKKIWKANWDQFAPLLAHVKPPLTKAEFLKDIQAANDIRKPAMHATKRVLAGVPQPGRDTFIRLTRIAEYAGTMLDAAANTQSA